MYGLLILVAMLVFLVVMGIRWYLLDPNDAYVTSTNDETREPIRTWDPIRFWSNCYDILVIVTPYYGHEEFKFDRPTGLWVSRNRTLPLHAKDLVGSLYKRREDEKRHKAIRNAKERVWGNVVEGNEPSTPRPEGK